MKKLNRKGFTLIELLAIIVILAIIMVVTIPTVLSSMGTAREEMFQTSANTVADWVEKQYVQAMMQMSESSYNNFCNKRNRVNCTKEAFVYRINSTSSTENKGFSTEDGFDNTVAFLKAAGVEPSNYNGIYVHINNGRACVKLRASGVGDFGSYKNTQKCSVGCSDCNFLTIDTNNDKKNDISEFGINSIELISSY